MKVFIPDRSSYSLCSLLSSQILTLHRVQIKLVRFYRSLQFLFIPQALITSIMEKSCYHKCTARNNLFVSWKITLCDHNSGWAQAVTSVLQPGSAARLPVTTKLLNIKSSEGQLFMSRKIKIKGSTFIILAKPPEETESSRYCHRLLLCCGRRPASLAAPLSKNIECQDVL